MKGGAQRSSLSPRWPGGGVPAGSCRTPPPGRSPRGKPPADRLGRTQPLGRVGVALPLILILLLALSALAHGGLVLARRELQAARGLAAAVEARSAARGAVEEGWERVRWGGGVPWDSSWGAGLELVPRVSEEGVWWGAALWRLAPEVYLVEGKGGREGRLGERREGKLVWRLDPVVRLRALRGTVEAAGGLVVVGSGRVEGGGREGEPRGWSSGICEAYGAALAEAMPAGGLVPVGSGGVGGGWGEGGPGLGLLKGAELLSRLDAEGWGGGEGAGCPGRGGPVGLALRGDGELVGGWLCGVVAAEGNARLRRGQGIQGVMVVGGDLVVEEGAWVEGWVGAGGRVVVGEGSVVRASGCAFLWAVEGLPRLREPLGLPGGGPFPLY